MQRFVDVVSLPETQNALLTIVVDFNAYNLLRSPRNQNLGFSLKVLEIFFRNLLVLVTQNRVVNNSDQDQHGILLAPIYYRLGAVHEDSAVTSHVGEAVIEVSFNVEPKVRAACLRIVVDRLDKPDEPVLCSCWLG